MREPTPEEKEVMRRHKRARNTARRYASEDRPWAASKWKKTSKILEAEVEEIELKCKQNRY